MDVKQMHQFLSGLAANNSKEWMDAHKKDYQTAKENFIGLVGEGIKQTSTYDPEIAAEEAKKCIFRLNRDVRFSNNKDPYKTNFGGSIAKGGRKSGNPGYYIHIMPDNNFAGGGLYHPEAEGLKKIRQEIDYNGADLVKIIENPSFKKVFPTPYDDKLKNAPKGYPKDHPHVELLKYKSLIFMRQFSDKEAQSKEFPAMIQETFTTIKPFLDFMRRGLD
jgi:uncharacterized protein (TIGR02453 family)